MGKKTTSAQEKRDLLLGFFHSTKQVRTLLLFAGLLSIASSRHHLFILVSKHLWNAG
jgi:hypothetical protein